MLTNDPKSSREIRGNLGIVQNQTVHSNDFIVNKTPLGTTVRLSPIHKRAYVQQPATDYSASAAYYIGQDIRVMPGETYYDYKGNGITASIGSWRCTRGVPEQSTSDLLIAAGSQSVYPNFCRQAGISYIPTYPEPTTGSSWQLIGVLTSSNSAGASIAPWTWNGWVAQTGPNCIYFTGSNQWTGQTASVMFPTKLQFSITTETLPSDGVSIGYTLYNTSSQTRFAGIGSDTSVQQVIVPRYIPGDTVWVATVVNGSNTYFIDVNVDGRAWANCSTIF